MIVALAYEIMKKLETDQELEQPIRDWIEFNNEIIQHENINVLPEYLRHEHGVIIDITESVMLDFLEEGTVVDYGSTHTCNAIAYSDPDYYKKLKATLITAFNNAGFPQRKPELQGHRTWNEPDGKTIPLHKSKKVVDNDISAGYSASIAELVAAGEPSIANHAKSFRAR